jgi:putative phosphoesterase
MKIVCLGDVHANLPALEAVLEDSRRRGGDIVLNTGDIVGYGPWPEECATLLLRTQMAGVIGNYDAKVLDAKKRLDEWKKTKAPEKIEAFLWTRHALSRATREELSRLPETRRFTAAGKRFLIAHGSPDSPDEFVGPETPGERLDAIADTSDADVVLLGHTHAPFLRKVRGVWIVNPGSVGRPEGGDPRASYAILNVRDGYFRVTHYRVPYDVERTTAALRELGMPASLTDVFERARPMIPSGGREAAEMALARMTPENVRHSRQVTRLALALFDGTRGLHGLGDDARRRLELAAVLHDIGWSGGAKGHQKRSMRLILERPDLIPDGRDRTIVALLARYHGTKEPGEDDERIGSLTESEREEFTRLAALLRLADGLDFTHADAVRDVDVTVDGTGVRIRVGADSEPLADIGRAMEKSGPFRKAFDREPVIEWRPI